MMGIQFYNGLSNFNYNRINDIPKVDDEQFKVNQKPQEEPVKEEAQSSLSPATLASLDDRARVSNLEDISLTFNKEESFEYLESDSSVKSLDMQKAISDMQKDGILQEYQYFVGSSKNLFEGDDGIVIPKN